MADNVLFIGCRGKSRLFEKTQRKISAFFDFADFFNRTNRDLRKIKGVMLVCTKLLRRFLQ